MARCLIASIVLTIFVSLQHEVIARPPLRIINGTTAEEGEFPYMVQLLQGEDFECGGSILAPEWILTAAHCVYLVDSIVYGTNKIYGYGNTTILINDWFRHPNFTHTNLGVPIYDVGILKLAESIPFGKNAQSIRIAEANAEIPFHVQGVVSGWGSLAIYGDLPDKLQKINHQLLTDEECLKKIGDYMEDETAFNPIHHLCSDDNHDGVSHGDSGSPYVINGTQYGITSWSASPGLVPGAYTRFTNPEYRNWIKNITGI